MVTARQVRTTVQLRSWLSGRLPPLLSRSVIHIRLIAMPAICLRYF